MRGLGQLGALMLVLHLQSQPFPYAPMKTRLSGKELLSSQCCCLLEGTSRVLPSTALCSRDCAQE